jgi:hypothetical protein
LVCHSVEKWDGAGDSRKVIGTTFDGWDKFNYELDLLVEAIKTNKQRKFLVKASRVEELPEGTLADLEFEKFAEIFGIEKLTKETKTYNPATHEQIGLMQEIISKNNLSNENVNKWLQKMNCDDLSEIPTEKAQEFIDGYKAREVKNA